MQQTYNGVKKESHIYLFKYAAIVCCINIEHGEASSKNVEDV